MTSTRSIPKFVSRQDFIASLVVFIVALPLSLGIAMASGASAASGLIAAVLGGIVAGVLSGAPLVVSGPAAGLVALVHQIVQEHGLAGMAVITVLAGAAQVALGIARAGKIFTYVPKAVLEGMLSAIGLMISSASSSCSPEATSRVRSRSILALGGNADSASEAATLPVVYPALACGLLAISVQLAWPRLMPKMSLASGRAPSGGRRDAGEPPLGHAPGSSRAAGPRGEGAGREFLRARLAR